MSDPTKNLGDLAAIFGGEVQKDLISKIDEENTNNISIRVEDGDIVRIIGGGIGGNAKITFNDSAGAEKFHDFLEEARSVGILEEILGGDLTWNALAEAAGAEKSRELVSKIGDDLWEDAVRVRDVDGGYKVNIAGRSVGGFADAVFADKADAESFERIMETLVDEGFSGALFDLPEADLGLA